MIVDTAGRSQLDTELMAELKVHRCQQCHPSRPCWWSIR